MYLFNDRSAGNKEAEAYSVISLGIKAVWGHPLTVQFKEGGKGSMTRKAVLFE